MLLSVQTGAPEAISRDYAAAKGSPQKVLVAEHSVRGMKIVRAMYSSFGTYPPSRHVWLSCEGRLPPLWDTDTPRPDGRGLTQNISYTPYASAQKRTPSSKEEKTGNRWRPPLNTLASVSSRFFNIYVSFDQRS